MEVTRSAQQDAARRSERTAVSTIRYRGNGWCGEFLQSSPVHEWLLAGGRPDCIPVLQESIVRDGSRSRCARITSLGKGAPPLPQPLFFKAYRRRRGAQAWAKRLIGWHLPSWVWRMSWRLIAAGVPVARPFGYLVPQALSIGKTSYFWSEWIEGAQPAKSLARDSASRHLVVADVAFAERSAEILAGLHDAGVYHRDMNWGNLLVNTDSGEVRLIDLDSAHRWTNNARSALGRDLARFLMDAIEYETSADWRKRFLDEYARLRRLSIKELELHVHNLMRDFYERRRKKQQRKANRSAPQDQSNDARSAPR